MLYSIPFLFSALLVLLFSYIAVVNSKRSEPNIVFILLSIFVFFWQVSWFIMQYFHGYGNIIAKIGHMWIVFIPVLLFHFGLVVIGKVNRTFLAIGYFLAILFEFSIIFTNYIIDGTHAMFWGVYPKAGEFHFLFMLFVSVMVTKILWLLILEYKKTKVLEKKKQYKYLIMGIVAFSLSAVDFLANYNFDVYPMGFAFLWIFLGLMFYAISKYNLISANALLDKFFVVFTLSTVTYFFWFVLFFLEQRYIGDVLGDKVLILNIIIVPAFIFALIEIYKKVSEFSQNFFHTFQGRKILENIVLEVSRLDNYEKFPAYLSEKLAVVFTADCYVYFQNDGKVELESNEKIEESSDLNDKKKIWSIIGIRKKFTILKEQKLKSMIPGSYRNKLIDVLGKENIEIIIPISENICILLGEKDSKKRYSSEEITFLKSLSEKFEHIF